jgi:hypothetical protein
MMELKMTPFSIPEAPSFNYDELKTAVAEKAALYETVVYTDDQVKTAKEDRANLNRLKKALNDERLRQEREYMQPFNAFKAQINEIIAIIDKPIAVIDKQVKAFEEQQKEAKFAQIEDFWNSCELPAPVKLLQIMDSKWLNASVPMKTIQEAITARLEQMASDLSAIRQLPAYAFEAEQTYLASFDLARAIKEAHRLQEMAERKAAHEAEVQRRIAEQQAATVSKNETVEPAPVAEVSSEPAREWIAFQAYLTHEEAKALGNYMKTNGIKYKAG